MTHLPRELGGLARKNASKRQGTQCQRRNNKAQEISAQRRRHTASNAFDTTEETRTSKEEVEEVAKMAARYLEHPDKLPDEHCKAIGRVVAQWTRAEVYLQAIIWHHMGLDFKQGRTLTHSISAERKLKILAGITVKWGATKKSAIMDIHDEAEGLKAWRNKFVHGVWGHMASKPERPEMMYINNVERAVLPTAQVFEAADIEKIADNIDQLTEKMKV